MTDPTPPELAGSHSAKRSPDFLDTLMGILAPGITVFACVGGHGRTGTALAAMLIAAGMAPEDAIAYVRQKHCRSATETPGQTPYLLHLR